jgi:hypothetical protein
MLKYILILFFLSLSFRSSGQESKLSEAVVSIAEELAADDSDPEAASTYIERLYELSEDKVKLNSSGEEELSRLFFLSDFQVKALADYVHSSGRINSVFELANIPGFDKETAVMMIPFITLDNKTTMNSDSAHWRNTSVTNLTCKPGNDDSSSSGSPWKILTKYKFTSGSFSGGMTAEKDPGEKFISGNTALPDFFSASLEYNGSGIVRRIIVGDYSARFGQGTNINTGIRSALSLTSPGYMSASNEVKPYTSADENNFFRGAAAEFSIKNLSVSLFYSKNRVDATLGSSSGSSNNYIENFYTTGLHNTRALEMKKDVVSELAYGTNLSYNFNNLRIGMTWSENRFSLPVNRSENNAEKLFDFEGDRNSLFSLYYNSLIKRILFFGEYSAGRNNKHAIVQGVSLRPSDRLTINFLIRNYDAGYSSFHGKGPGNSSSGNEHGILGNFSFEAAKHLFLSAGCDISSFPWLKYSCNSPSWGRKQEVRLKYLPVPELTIDAAFNYRLSIADDPEANGIPGQKRLITKSLKGSVKYSINDDLILGTRIDYKYAEPSGSRGMLMQQEVNYHFRQIPLTLWIRYCLFSTDDWDSRIYSYENDLLYSFSIPSLSGAGSRSYIMAKWEVNDIAEMRIKYGITTIIRGANLSENNDEIKVQFRIMF